MGLIAGANHLEMAPTAIGNASTHLGPLMSALYKVKWCRALAEDSISITRVNERMKGRSRSPEERVPYSGGRPAGGEDALSIGRVGYRLTPCGGRKSRVGQTEVMLQNNHTSQ